MIEKDITISQPIIIYLFDFFLQIIGPTKYNYVRAHEI